MRVALVSLEYPPVTQSSGIASYTHKTARALARRGHEVHVVTEANDLAGADTCSDGVWEHRLPNPGLRPRELRQVRRSVDVARAVRRLGPFDVVQACEWLGEATVHSLAHRTPLVTRLATPHDLVLQYNRPRPWDTRRAWLVRRMERFQARHSDIVITPSRALAEWVAAAWELSTLPTVVPTGIEIHAPNGVDLHRLSADDGEHPYLLYFGRLEPRKGIQDWLEALPGVLARNPGVSAVFVGEDQGDGHRSYEAMARERWPGLSGRVRFVPAVAVDSLRPIVAGARVVVFPSLWESVSNACLEAMALGRPVVATSGSGFAELIEDGRSGILVPPGQPQQLGTAVNSLLADPSRLRDVGVAARRRAATFDIEACVDQLVDVYHQLAGKAPTRVVTEAAAE